jgi:hypothetical protein
MTAECKVGTRVIPGEASEVGQQERSEMRGMRRASRDAAVGRTGTMVGIGIP